MFDVLLLGDEIYNVGKSGNMKDVMTYHSTFMAYIYSPLLQKNIFLYLLMSIPYSFTRDIFNLFLQIFFSFFFFTISSLAQ